MRVFSTQSAWDAKEQRYFEVYYIDGREVSFEEYIAEMDADRYMNDDSDVENGNMLDDSNCEPCQCVECKSARDEFTEDEEIQIGLVEHYADLIEDIECTCGCELRNILMSLVQECISLGYEEAKEEMESELEEICDEPKNITINIDNLTFNDVTNGKDLITQLEKYAMIHRKEFFV